ncbi:hypothetical protein HPB47_006157, partial [Ixodes persulcatus]
TPKMDSQLRCRYYTGETGFFKLQPIKLEEYNLKPYVVVLRDLLQDRDLDDMIAFAKPRLANYGIGGHYVPHHDYLEESLTSKHMSDVEEGGATVFPSLGVRVSPKKGDAVFWWNIKSSWEGDLLTWHAGCPVLYGSKWTCHHNCQNAVCHGWMMVAAKWLQQLFFAAGGYQGAVATDESLAVVQPTASRAVTAVADGNVNRLGRDGWVDFPRSEAAKVAAKDGFRRHHGKLTKEPS